MLWFSLLSRFVEVLYSWVLNFLVFLFQSFFWLIIHIFAHSLDDPGKNWQIYSMWMSSATSQIYERPLCLLLCLRKAMCKHFQKPLSYPHLNPPWNSSSVCDLSKCIKFESHDYPDLCIPYWLCVFPNNLFPRVRCSLSLLLSGLLGMTCHSMISLYSIWH